MPEPPFAGCLQQRTELMHGCRCLAYLRFQILLSDFSIHHFAACKCMAAPKVLKEEFLGWGRRKQKRILNFFNKMRYLYIKYILSVFYFVGLYPERISMRTDACPPTLPNCVSSHEEEQFCKRKVCCFHTYVSFVN